MTMEREMLMEARVVVAVGDGMRNGMEGVTLRLEQTQREQGRDHND